MWVISFNTFVLADTTFILWPVTTFYSSDRTQLINLVTGHNFLLRDRSQLFIS